jgi:arginase family enzyme
MCYLAGNNSKVVMMDMSEYNPAVEKTRTGSLLAHMFY